MKEINIFSNEISIESEKLSNNNLYFPVKLHIMNTVEDKI